MPGLAAIAWIVSPLIVWMILLVVCLLRGKRRGHLRRTLVLAAVGHGVVAIALWFLIVAREPAFTTPLMETSDKIALRDAVQESRGSSEYRFSLDPGLITRGLRTGADLLHVEFHSRLDLGDDNHGRVEVSTGHPAWGFLNLAAEGTASVSEGQPSIEFESLRLGRLPLPFPVKQIVAWIVVDAVQAVPVTAIALHATDRAEIRDGRLELAIRRRSHLIKELVGRLRSPEVTETNELAWEVAQLWSRTDRGEGEAWFIESTREFFSTTQRLAPKWSAVRQNRAAILAGGIALGDPRIAQFAGQSRADANEINRHGSTARVHGRRDLVQHFWVSAALSGLSSSRMSGAVGMSKEEMDSGIGGSGFSFIDMLANGAGIRFEKIATASVAQAKLIQRRVAGPWTIDDLIPSIDGLTEGIPQAEFEAQYGGVDSKRFQEQSAEIERRLGGARLLSPSGE